MNLRNSLLASALFAASITANAAVVRVSQANFVAGAGLITFSEFPVNTMNPTYAPATYGGGASAPNVTFDGWFTGQRLSLTPAVDCPGAAATACIVGSPTGPLSLDPASPNTFITQDGANPTSPVLSGTPIFNGGIAVLFDRDLVGVGFDGGFFDAVGSTGITAFARDGSLLGTITNRTTGIEFLGIADSGGAAVIAGVFLDLTGSEPAGFAIDNLRFGMSGQVVIDPVNPVPEPGTMGLVGIAIAGLGLTRRRRSA